jgi:hypothetical protein
MTLSVYNPFRRKCCSGNSVEAQVRPKPVLGFEWDLDDCLDRSDVVLCEAVVDDPDLPRQTN